MNPDVKNYEKRTTWHPALGTWMNRGMWGGLDGRLRFLLAEGPFPAVVSSLPKSVGLSRVPVPGGTQQDSVAGWLQGGEWPKQGRGVRAPHLLTSQEAQPDH